ncbi:hypothetical protein B0T20DRAFT_232911 [Sordaria brevicollis]|uniref:Secreted protein n=1 Tax=Sordaria brevicollis TaxID=83679 RepID=A0AAE0PDE9_SORBR|nr:hypothetical protein B0T20DRAFT_232911 [Sordaria brevicollis]
MVSKLTAFSLGSIFISSSIVSTAMATNKRRDSACKTSCQKRSSGSLALSLTSSCRCRSTVPDRRPAIPAFGGSDTPRVCFQLPSQRGTRRGALFFFSGSVLEHGQSGEGLTTRCDAQRSQTMEGFPLLPWRAAPIPFSAVSGSMPGILTHRDTFPCA